MQLRCGILPLHAETGRYRGVPEDEGICEYCELNEVENEICFILYCPSYQNMRQKLFEKVQVPDLNLMSTENGALIEYLLGKHFCIF